MLRLLAAVVVLTVFCGSAWAQCGSEWTPGGLGRGFDGSVYASATWDPDGAGPGAALLVVGGAFRIADNLPLPFLAVWDGSTWASLGGSPNGIVRCITVRGNTLLIGGEFTMIGNVAAARIAVFDGTTWSALGEGFSNTVRAIGTFNGEIVAGGKFTEFAHIAKWNGQEWLSVPAVLNGEVTALYEHGGTLLIGGDFSARAVRWNGTVATPITGLGARVPAARMFVEWNGQLIMGGRSALQGDPFIFRVEGTTAYVMMEGLWSVLGGDRYEAPALHVHGGTLYCGGTFSHAAASWNGSAWILLPNTFGQYGDQSAAVLTLTTFDQKLVAGGSFSAAAGRVANYLSYRSDGEWLSPCSGPLISRLAAAEAGVSYRGERVFGGTFHLTDGQGATSYHAARFDGSGWRSMPGLGNGSSDTQTVVRVLCVHEDVLYGAGTLYVPGTTQWCSMIWWDGSVWRPVMPLVSGDAYAMTVMDGEFVLGGFFYVAGAPGGIANAVRLRKGQWQQLGSPPGSISCFAEFEGQLYAGGPTIYGSQPAFVSRWTGASWQSTSWPGGRVHAMTNFQGRLIAGGYFQSPLGQLGVGQWNNQAWSWLSPGPGPFARGQVQAFAVSGNTLAIGGWQGNLGLEPVLALWNGQELVYNSGLSFPSSNPSVDSLMWRNDGLWVGGRLEVADGVASPAIARLGAPGGACYADCDCSGTLSILDFQCFIEQYSARAAYANCDDNSAQQQWTANDFGCFLNRFAMGCP